MEVTLRAYARKAERNGRYGPAKDAMGVLDPLRNHSDYCALPCLADSLTVCGVPLLPPFAKRFAGHSLQIASLRPSTHETREP